METERDTSKPDLESSLYIGAIATAIVYLLPYVNVVLFGFPIPPYAVGALVAVWHAVKKRGQLLRYGNGAKLGFLSTFLGGIASAVVFDIIWQFFDFQLWQKQNSDLLIAIFSAIVSPATLDVMKMKMADQATKPFGWTIIILQLIAGLICSGLFGSLFGVLGVKIFQRRTAR